MFATDHISHIHNSNQQHLGIRLKLKKRKPYLYILNIKKIKIH